MKSKRIAVASVLALQLSACGGGSGDGVNSTPTPTPAPTPAPTPTPTPAPTPTPTPTPAPTPTPTPTPTSIVLPPISNQTSSTSFPFTAIGSQRLSYDAVAKSYTVADAYTPATNAPVTFTATDIVAGDDNYTTYQHADAAGSGRVDRLALSKPGSDNTKIALTYSGYGSYSNAAASAAPSYFSFGVAPTATPVSGIASYSGVVDGCDVTCGNKISGTSTLSLNLQSATLTTQLALTFTQKPVNNGVVSLLSPITLNGIGYLDTSALSALHGSLTNSDGSVQGSFTGGLYGPNGEEAGFSFTTSTSSTSAAGGLYNLNGVASAKLRGTTANPADQSLASSLQRGEAFNAANASIILYSSTSANISSSASGQNLLRYDAATDSYILTRDSFTNQGHAQTLGFGPADRQADVANFAMYGINDPSDPTNAAKGVSIGLFKVGAANTTINLTYTSYGFYAFAGADGTRPTNDYNIFLYGVGTPASAMPTSGSASYSGIVDGAYVDPAGTYRITGTSALNANFAAHSLTTSMTFTGANIVSGGPALASQTFNGSASSSASQYHGTLSNAASTVSGTFTGGFFGPHAEEYGYAFQVGNGTTSANGTVAGVGIALGKR